MGCQGLNLSQWLAIQCLPLVIPLWIYFLISLAHIRENSDAKHLLMCFCWSLVLLCFLCVAPGVLNVLGRGHSGSVCSIFAASKSLSFVFDSLDCVPHTPESQSPNRSFVLFTVVFLAPCAELAPSRCSLNIGSAKKH